MYKELKLNHSINPINQLIYCKCTVYKKSAQEITLLENTVHKGDG